MKTLAFVVLSAYLIYISRNALRAPRSHGFYRFFAWECMLALFLLNMNFWFYQPFSGHQMIAWVLLFVSLIPLGFGIHFLRTRGNPTAKREGDNSLLGFEKTTSLVTMGIYKYIRHPLYSSLLFVAWGIFFKAPSLPGIALTAVASAYLFATAKADETECVIFFGNEYQEYIKRTKMFIPYII